MQPWVTGPVELLEHGLMLLRLDNDSNRRLAMIAIDNAVELGIKTYLSLPKRVTGIAMSRKDFSEISESFPRLVEALEVHCIGKLDGIDLSEVEWYHRLRNQLYHQGNGLTVERNKVSAYSELARVLFMNLFAVKVELQRSGGQELLGAFLEAWISLEKTIAHLARQYRNDLTVTGGRMPAPRVVFEGLAALGVVSEKTARRIDYFRALRNRLVHGEINPASTLNEESIDEVRLLRDEIDSLAEK